MSKKFKPGMKKNRSANVRDFFNSGALIFAENCSMHGWHWYTKVNNLWSKFAVWFFVSIIFWLTSSLCAKRAWLFYNTMDNESASQRQNSYGHHSFPNITICHPKYFNKNMLEGVI